MAVNIKEIRKKKSRKIFKIILVLCAGLGLLILILANLTREFPSGENRGYIKST